MQSNFQVSTLVVVLLLGNALSTLSAEPVPRQGDILVPNDFSLEKDQEEEYVEVVNDGMIFGAPYFPDGLRFTEAKLLFDQAVIKALQEFIGPISEKLLYENASIIRYGPGCMKGMWNLFKSLKTDYHELLKTDTSPRMSKEFSTKMGRLMMDITDSKSKQKMDGKEAHECVMKSLEGIRMLIKASPVGMYLDWTKMRIDGVLLSEHYAPVIQNLRDNSRGPILRAFKMIGAALQKF